MRINLFGCFLLLCAAPLLVGGSARAADYFVTVNGAGAKNGASWDHAFPFSSVNDVLNRTMKPGDTLHLEGARYGAVQLTINSSGEAGAPKTIIGEDRGGGLPILRATDGGWMNWEQYGLLFKAGSSHWVVKNLEFRGYAEPTVSTEGGHTGLVLDHLRVVRAYTGFKLVDCHDTVIRNCYATLYSQQGFVFLNHCERVLVQDCEADGSQGDIPPGDVSQVGYQCGSGQAVADADGNTHMTFENCVARNNLESDYKQGWVQGDGFAAELADRHMKFLRCRSLNASDGCFDLKAQIDEFTDCVAAGPGRGFKLWWQTMTMKNCIAILTEGGRFRTTGTTCALEVNNRRNDVDLGGHITAQSCTFAIVGGGPGFWGESGKATLRDCIVSFTSPEPKEGTVKKPTERDVTIAYDRSAIHWNAVDSNPPGYLKPAAEWDGIGSNYDSQTHGTDKGYHSSRVGKAPPAK